MHSTSTALSYARNFQAGCAVSLQSRGRVLLQCRLVASDVCYNLLEGPSSFTCLLAPAASCCLWAVQEYRGITPGLGDSCIAHRRCLMLATSSITYAYPTTSVTVASTAIHCCWAAFHQLGLPSHLIIDFDVCPMRPLSKLLFQSVAIGSLLISTLYYTASNASHCSSSRPCFSIIWYNYQISEVWSCRVRGTIVWYVLQCNVLPSGKAVH